MSLLSVLSALSPASAFPGAFLGDGSGQPVNTKSVITVARFGDQTALTLQPDVQGALSTFGLVIPVPPGFTRADLSLVNPHATHRADQYSAPRLLNTRCEDLYAGIGHPPYPQDTGPQDTDPLGPCSYSGGCKEGMTICLRDTEPLPDWFAVPEADLSVEDGFELAEYTGWILTPADGETLADWMAQQGFIADTDTAARLYALVNQGSAFVALRVALDQAPRRAATLSPIQLRYTSDGWTLPMQLSAASSAEVQDVTLITLTDSEKGATVIKNVVATPLPDAVPPTHPLNLLEEPSSSTNRDGQNRPLTHNTDPGRLVLVRGRERLIPVAGAEARARIPAMALSGDARRDEGRAKARRRKGASACIFASLRLCAPQTSRGGRSGVAGGDLTRRM